MEFTAAGGPWRVMPARAAALARDGSVLGWSLDVIDDEDRHAHFIGLELQTELFLKCGEEIWVVIIDRCICYARRPRYCVVQRQRVEPLQAGPIHDLPAGQSADGNKQ